MTNTSNSMVNLINECKITFTKSLLMVVTFLLTLGLS